MAKFEWIKTQAEKLDIPPPPKLSTFGLFAAGKNRKKGSEIIKEVFLQEDIVVDNMHMNLVPPPRVEGSRGLDIMEPESGIFFYNGNFDLRYQRLTECNALASSEGLADYKASASNLRCIQVKDIIKEVEDYLKTYSSDGMNIRCQLSQSVGLYKFACKLDSLSSLLVQKWIEKLIIDEKVTLVDDEGKPLEMVVSSSDYDSEDGIASVDNEMASFLAKNDGYGTQSLLEQWTKSYENDDYEYNPYDNDMYEDQEIPDKLQGICDNLDIKVSGPKKK
uniref:Uncharacterized protein n=1 Tax=Tanacetum cinerariifolium TaxID=118510 RepID=A0A6L2NFV1_TANCI|nr:hypothetical protein [Tanacetum cinerariifolium]